MAIFHGPERYLQLQRTAELKAALTSRHGEVTVFAFGGGAGGGGASPAEILDECRSLSLMQTHKMVVVDGADALLKAAEDEEGGSGGGGLGGRGGGKTAREMFEAYAEAPDSSATLVLRAGTWRPGRLDKAVLASGGVVVKCESPSDAEAAAWVRGRAAHHQTSIDADAAARLVEAVGADLARLDSELAKLSLVKPGAAISAEVVRQFVGVSREEDFWEVQGSLLSGDAQRALGHLRELLDVSRHDATPLLFTYCDLARRLHGAARGLAARENPASLMGRLKMWGSAGEAVMARARTIRPEAAADLLGAVVDGMVRQRSGLGDPEHILEGLTLRFCDACR